MPVLIEAMEQAALARPFDPIEFIAKILLKKQVGIKAAKVSSEKRSQPKNLKVKQETVEVVTAVIEEKITYIEGPTQITYIDEVEPPRFMRQPSKLEVDIS